MLHVHKHQNKNHFYDFQIPFHNAYTLLMLANSHILYATKSYISDPKRYYTELKLNPNKIQKTIVLEFPSDQVFKAITDEKELQKWWVDVPLLQPTIGGNVFFRFLKEKSENLTKDFVIEGKVVELVPNQKISYTWKPVDDPSYPKTVVSWILEPIDNNRTKVTLTHSGLERVYDYTKLDEGWSYFIAKLEKLLENSL